jgi:hypothetical protein
VFGIKERKKEIVTSFSGCTYGCIFIMRTCSSVLFGYRKDSGPVLLVARSAFGRKK